MISKHLMPVPRRSAALFMLLGFQMLQEKTDRNSYIFFCTNVTNFMAGNKTGPLKGAGPGVVFPQSLFISLKCFYFLFLICVL